MHITLEADYAVRIVNSLAQAKGRMDAKSVSESTGVTLRFSLKILHKLVSAGIVRSYKGTNGGYELARPGSEITLRDVIETVEGPYAFSRCLTPGFTCSCPPDCRFQGVYDDISEIVRKKLSEVHFGG